MKEKEKPILLPIGENDTGRRLDRIIRKILPGHHLSTIYGDIRKGRIRVNGKKRKGAYRLRAGDTILLPGEYTPLPFSNTSSKDGGTKRDPSSQFASFCLLYENQDFLICNKKPGYLTHGNNGLNEEVLAYVHNINPMDTSLAFTPGPLHRLDRNTSGILYFNKSIQGARIFSSLQKAHCLLKLYIAVVEGTLKEAGTWENVLTRDRGEKITRVRPWAGEGPSRCSYWPLAHSRDKTLLAVELRSGFTHQIRVQSGYNGYPLWGDTKYGGARRAGSSYFLHAFTIYDTCSSSELRSSSKDLGFPQVIAPLHKRFSSFILEEFSITPEKVLDSFPFRGKRIGEERS